MKKGKILNSGLSSLIGNVAHGDLVIISDAGLAVPKGTERIDLAIERNMPNICHILKLLQEELIVEKVQITNECKVNNRPHYDDVRAIYENEDVIFEDIDHSLLISKLVYKAKAVVRTGSFCPYGNVVIYPGIDAPKWFEREGLTVPPCYQSRVKK